MADRWTRLATLAAHGANVQPGQVVLVQADLGHLELARAVTAAAYDRGAKYVDVNYFDPYVKRARIEHADPDTLDARALDVGVEVVDVDVLRPLRQARAHRACRSRHARCARA